MGGWERKTWGQREGGFVGGGGGEKGGEKGGGGGGASERGRVGLCANNYLHR